MQMKFASQAFVKHYTAILLFTLATIFIPCVNLHLMTMMPGDLGDGRLNNYFLENIFQWCIGNSDSLWHLSFFAPFPYVGGFSDNLFGSSPVYLLSRLITGKSDTAFQLWYFLGYLINFAAAYYSLFKLENSAFASAVGALIFSFAFPEIIQISHAQLHYRFAAPVAITMLMLFLQKKEWKYFISAVAWLVWQFYCTIYIGVFTFLIFASCISGYVSYLLIFESKKLIDYGQVLISNWRLQPYNKKICYISALFLFFLFMVLLFYPYLRVTQLYGAHRPITEIASMLPRLQSYLLADNSWIWKGVSGHFNDIPMRHEHQLFIGFVPMFLVFWGISVGRKKKNQVYYGLFIFSLIILILVTLNIHGHSLWFIFAHLPLFSAIRAMTRIILILLFPVSYLGAVSIDWFLGRPTKQLKIIPVILIIGMIVEFSSATVNQSPKTEWRNRINCKRAMLPSELPSDSIIVYAQSDKDGPFFAQEIDAMWVALIYGVKTLNGYSGLMPSGMRYEFGDDRTEISNRVASYLQFIGRKEDVLYYQSLMKRVVPIGFER